MGSPSRRSLDALLAQATCAIVRPGPAGFSAVATAWLASSSGYLVTAGHTFFGKSGLSREAPIGVMFPGDRKPREASFIIGKHDKAAAMDYAILKLALEPTDRDPLPFMLVDDVSGRFRLHGYSSNLPNAQSAGAGEFTTTRYLRGADQSQYLFQLSSAQLVYKGLSGGAVYSEERGAAVAIQIEAKRQGNIVLAMPLARIAEDWQDMVAVAVRPDQKNCVVLVPKNRDKGRLDKLLAGVIRPVLQSELSFALDFSTPGETNPRDLALLEQADLVIADITDDDTNVTHELTIAQGFGTPDIVIADAAAGRDFAQSPFDVTVLDVDRPDEARAQLRQKLAPALLAIDVLKEPPANRLVRFFGAPLTHVSAAVGLAVGYHYNFVRKVGDLLCMIRGGVGGAGVDIRIGGDAPEHSLSSRELQKVVFDVVIPPRLAWANHAFILRNIKEPGHAVPAYLRTPQSFRPFELLALPAARSDGTLHLVDVPTTMSVMAFAIDERLNVATPQERDRQRGWAEIEAREIDRFRSHLVRRIERTQNSFHPFRRVVSVVNWRAIFPAPTIF